MNATTQSDWAHVSLPRQFLIAGSLVMVGAALVVGFWVSNRIENAVVQNSANAAALYMESYISPLSQELADGDALSTPAKRALVEIFDNTPLGERVVSYKIWKPGGLVVHASDPAIIGNRFEPTENLKAAWQGRVSASFENLDQAENEAEAALGVPLLEVYSPIRELWSGEIIAVAEFYQRADALTRELANARWTSWLVVGATFLVSGLLLFGIVRAGGQVIQAQGQLLEERLRDSVAMAEQNLALRARVVGASARAAAQADRALRRLGADLHDGPAQYLALAILRLDAVLSGKKAEGDEAAEIRNSLNTALSELRAMSRGLAIPDLDGLSLRELVDRALEQHGGSGRSRPALEYSGPDQPDLGYGAKLCVYRFLQEALSNAARYAPETTPLIQIEVGQGAVIVNVSDDGPGFDPAQAIGLRSDGGQGLMGLIDRAESIGGQVDVISEPGRGTRVRLTLQTEKEPA